MIDLIEPSGFLRPHIKNYLLVETDKNVHYLPTERVFPSGNATMVFHYGVPSNFKPKNSNGYIEPELVLCGQRTNYYDLSLSGKTGMVIILFKPHGVKSFFNFPATELLNRNLSLHEILNNEAIELEDNLQNSCNNEERIACLENFLIKRLLLTRDFKRVEHAVRIIEAFKGQIRTEHLANEVSLGIKQFERVFSNHVGLNPKKFISLTRLQNVLKMKDKITEVNLSRLAVDNGYYDQSHFNHDFKNLTGLTPRKYFFEKNKD